jgi:transketolase C-terminal domain/subunit
MNAEHSIVGGLGSAVAEVMAEEASRCGLLRLGLPDAYLHFSTYEGYLERAGLSAPTIASTVADRLAVRSH